MRADCIHCHMPRREVFDGNHTVFTDHRIMRRPTADSNTPDGRELAAWRETGPEMAMRNLALAYVNAGAERNSPAWIVRGYRMLTTVQATFSRDIAVMRGFGTALLMGNQPGEAQIAFERVLALDGSGAIDEENAGRACLAGGNVARAEVHLERALRLDPLLLSTAELLEDIYQKQGDTAKQMMVAERVERAMRDGTAHETKH
jgi:predicted Zn-dependent protease